MSSGLLTAPRSLELDNGWTLELLSAWEAVEAKAQAEQMAEQNREAGLCANACLLAKALRRDGQLYFSDGKAVMEQLTARQIAELSAKWAEFDRQVNPSVLDGEEAVERIKKVWSTRLMSAFSGVCSSVLAYFPRRHGPDR